MNYNFYCCASDCCSADSKVCRDSLIGVIIILWSVRKYDNFRILMFANRKTVTVDNQQYSLLILPIFSLSNPNPKSGHSRMVFDWGRGLSHPHAKIAFAVLSNPVSNWIERIIFENFEYKIIDIKKCRSGRLAATVIKRAKCFPYDRKIIDILLSQEFGKNIT